MLVRGILLSINMARTVIIVALCAVAITVFAQGTPEFTHEIVSSKANQLPGRDFWFTMPKNYESQSGKYYELYITSNRATIVHIQVTGGTASVRAIKALEVYAFKIPLGWEVQTSGVVEDLGIHVWSDDADLNVNLLSRNPATSDGMNIIPVSAWGNKYVVAAYHALYEGFGTTYDYPSEFSVIAAFDSTLVTIITSADLRKSGLKNDILHAKGDTFSIMLNRGQVVQYMTVLAKNADDYDVTGTVITSNKPIGVVGASQCPNIPPEYPYCDHICEMIPPVSSWGRTYHTHPFYNRKGGDSFLVIGSKSGQNIYLNGVPYATLNKFTYLFRPDIIDAGTWTSDAPFLLAQYINSTTWVDPITGQDNNGVGDPSMVVINPFEQYTKEVLFQTPTITTGTGFTHYANIFVHKDAVLTTTMDGIPISSYPSISSIAVPFSNYTCFRARSLKSGAHRLKSDEGVGVYVYGYGSYDSYAWNGALGARSISTVDTAAPKVAMQGDCYCARIYVSDFRPYNTGIASIVVDKSYNMSFALDPTLQLGIVTDSSYYDVCVLAPSDSAFIQVSAYDFAGHRTTVTSRIAARTAATFTPPSLSIAYAGPSIPNFATFTLKNTTTSPLSLTGSDGLRFTTGAMAFTLVDPDVSDLPVDASRSFKVQYVASDPLVHYDTLLLGNECSMAKLSLQSTDVGPVASTTGFDMGCIPLGTQKEDTIVVTNSAFFEFRITSVFVDDPNHFTVNTALLPVVLHAGERASFPAVYKANTLDTICTTVHIMTTELGELTAQLCGCALPQESVRESTNEAELRQSLRNGSNFAWLAPIPNPADRSSEVRFVFGIAKQSNVTLELFDLLGKRIDALSTKTYDGGIHEISFDGHMLIAGTYIYRYNIDGKPYSGMLTIR
jgi:hypothetical protein